MSEYYCHDCGEEVGMMGHGNSPCSKVGKGAGPAFITHRQEEALRDAVELAEKMGLQHCGHEKIGAPHSDCVNCQLRAALKEVDDADNADE